MAEGGDHPNDNPFSFRNFNKKKSNPHSDTLTGTSGDEREDVYDMPDVQNIGGNEEERNRRLTAADDERHRRPDENPFSFKRFLESSRPKVATGSLATLDLANDLPDFIQDHSTSPVDRRSRAAPPDVPLPDFALDSSASSGINPGGGGGGFDVNGIPDLDIDLPQNGQPLGMDLHAAPLVDYMDVGGGSRPKHGNPGPAAHGGGAGQHRAGFGFLIGSPPDIQPANNGHMSNSDAEDEDPDEILAIPQANATGGLPDFLSDSAVNSVDMRNSLENPMAVGEDFLYHSNGDYELENQRLREENRELRNQLIEAQQLAESQSRRVVAVSREMEAVERREAAETAALENMVQQVEANLTATTQRAVLAEKSVAKLKQEVRSLKVQLQTMCGSHGVISPPNDVIKEKAKYAAEQLSAAAKNAEATLQQLMSGVETLKLVSSVLSSIDKVTDAGAEGDTDEPPDGATGGSGGAGGAAV